ASSPKNMRSEENISATKCGETIKSCGCQVFIAERASVTSSEGSRTVRPSLPPHNTRGIERSRERRGRERGEREREMRQREGDLAKGAACNPTGEGEKGQEGRTTPPPAFRT